MKGFVAYELKSATKGRMPFRISRLGAHAWGLAELREHKDRLQEEFEGACWGILRLPDNEIEKCGLLMLAEENLRMPTQPSLTTRTAYVSLSRMDDGSDYIAAWCYTMKEFDEIKYSFNVRTDAVIYHRGSKISLSGAIPEKISENIWEKL